MTYLFTLFLGLAFYNAGASTSTDATDICSRLMRNPRRLIDTQKLDPVLDGQIATQLRRLVIGQPQIIAALLRQISRVQGPSVRRGMAGAVLLYGPTGLGKNKAGEVLAQLIGGSLIELEGGDFQTAGDITSLSGAGPKWVGHGITVPILTQEKIDQARGTIIPITIVMVNELDKAHESFLNWWLKPLDVGTSTIWMPQEHSEIAGSQRGANGVTLDLRRVLFIGTTNAGASKVQEVSQKIAQRTALLDQNLLDSADSIGTILDDEETLGPGFDRAIALELNRAFEKPEFLGRLDEIVPAWPLLRFGYRKVLALELSRVRAQLESESALQNIPIGLTARAKTWLLDQLDLEYGARNLTKIVDQFIKTPLAKGIRTEEVKSNERIIGELNADATDLIFYSSRYTPNSQTAGLRTPPPRSTPANLNFEQSQRLNAIADQELSDKKRLDTAAILLNDLKEITPENALFLLKNLPVGVEWVWLNRPKQYVNALLKKYDIGLWEVGEKDDEYLDICIVLSILVKIQRPLSKAKAQEIINRALEILIASGGIQNKPAAFAADVYTLVSAILNPIIER